jgi:hypothetical protein
MGLIFPGVPQNLVLFLKQRFDLQTFVETGTLNGDSAAWAAQYFAHVFTIEASETLWQAARTRHAQTRNIEFIHAKSPEALRALSPRLNRPLFWLDAHWSGGGTAGQEAECPLLEELAAIAGCAGVFVLIDDARLFLMPPPSPHNWRHWPDLATVTFALQRCGSPYVTVKDDVILAAPMTYQEDIADYLRK